VFTIQNVKGDPQVSNNGRRGGGRPKKPKGPERKKELEFTDCSYPNELMLTQSDIKETNVRSTWEPRKGRQGKRKADNRVVRKKQRSGGGQPKVIKCTNKQERVSQKERSGRGAKGIKRGGEMESLWDGVMG